MGLVNSFNRSDQAVILGRPLSSGFMQNVRSAIETLRSVNGPLTEADRRVGQYYLDQVTKGLSSKQTLDDVLADDQALGQAVIRSTMKLGSTLRSADAVEIQFKAAESRIRREAYEDTTPLAARLALKRTVPEGGPAPAFIMSVPQPQFMDKDGAKQNQNHWDTVKATIEALGGKVSVTTLPNRSDDLEHFIQDPLLVMPDKKIALMPVDSRYASVQQGLAQQVKAQGYEIIPYNGKGEGGDFAYDKDRKLIVIGPTFDLAEAAILKEKTGYNVLQLQVTDKQFYHLDIFMRCLPGGEFMINKSAITPESFNALQDAVGEGKIIDFKNSDPSTPVTNLTIVGSTLVMPYAPDKELAEKLESSGYSIVTPNDVGINAQFNAVSSGFQTENAANHCMVLEMQDGVRPVTGPIPAVIAPRIIQPGAAP